MSLNNNQKTNIALGIVIILTLLLSVFTIGYTLNDNSNKGYKNTQTTVVMSGEQKYKSSTETTKENLPVLGQSLREQQTTKTPVTTQNNIEINIHNTGYTGYGSYSNQHYFHPYSKYKNYNKNYNSRTSNPYYSGNKYYNSYYPYNQHGFYYTNSYGTTHKYNSW